MEPLVTVADLSTHLQREVDEGPAALAVAGASGAVRSHCRWDISREDAAFTVAGSGTRVLNLPTLHLVDVLAVRLDDGTELVRGGGNGEYLWVKRGQMYRSAAWPGPFRHVEVQCVHGYDPVPDVVRLVTLTIAAREYTNPMRLRDASVGSVTRRFDMTALDMALLDTYRLP